jgi:hypothetical protein
MSYQDDHDASHNLRQNDKAASQTAVAHRNADIAHYTRLLAAEVKWSVSNGALNALRSLRAAPESVAKGASPNIT